MPSLARSLLPLLFLLPAAFSQTETDCDPTKETCPDNPALGTTFETTFDASMTEFDPRFFNVSSWMTDLISFSDEGAALTIEKQGQSVTVETSFYIMFGKVEMIFKAATGVGIISTYNLLSDTLDEIDLEIMGGNYSYVSNNYYGWGNTSQFNSEYENVESWGSKGAMGGFHNYTVDWEQEKIDWYMDGELVRTADYLPPGQYPQTPSFLKFGIWAGGDPTLPKGTREWAGGDTDYSKGPFTMTVKSLKVVDSHTNVAYYQYMDQTGSYESIKDIAGQSPAFKAMHEKSTSQKVEDKWHGLSTGGKIGIAAAIGGTFLLAFIAFLFYCMRQRRDGRAEKERADKAWDAQQAENVELRGRMAAYQQQMKRGNFAVSHMGHGEKF